MTVEWIEGDPPGYEPRSVSRRRSTNAQLRGIDQAIIAAVATEHPATLRSVFYRVVSAGAVDKTERGYNIIKRELLKLRRSGRLPHRWIVDGTRWVTMPTMWDSVEDALGSWAESYRRDMWEGQDVEIQIFSEKDAITGVIQPVTRELGVALGITRGYHSESFAFQVAESIARTLRRTDKDVWIYDLGDHDPSGVDAWRAFEQRLTDFVGDDERVHFERLAVTPQQIDAYDLMTRPTKRSDTRAKAWPDGHGSVEVDAIAPNTLRRIVRDAIEQHIDPDQLALIEAVEEQERQGLRALRLGGDES